MKNYISPLLSVTIILWVIFYALTIIAQNNEFTSVRQYLLDSQQQDVNAEEIDTGVIIEEVIEDTMPPVIEITNYTNGQVVTDESIVVDVQVSDDVSTPENIIVSWAGKKNLTIGYNPIVVSATDETGNTAATYIIIERQ